MRNGGMNTTHSAFDAGQKQIPQDPLSAALNARDADVLTMVRRALNDGRARLAFQPVVTQGRVAFFECLIRILDETARVIPAGQFMPVVEDTALGREIDCAALRLGFEQLQRVNYARLSINTSARSIADGKWRRIMEEGLSSDPTIGERLILEIGETSAMTLPEVVIRFMEEVQPRGVSFALDDFGAGQTAFRYLKDFFFDLVKIDRCFMKDVDQNPDNQVLAEALMTVAHQFEMFAVAQGVESEAAAQYLSGVGMDCLQGFHIGVPKFTL